MEVEIQDMPPFYRRVFGDISFMEQRQKFKILFKCDSEKCHYLYTDEKAGQCKILEFKTVLPQYFYCSG